MRSEVEADSSVLFSKLMDFGQKEFFKARPTKSELDLKKQ
jgi:hypothetical protein